MKQFSTMNFEELLAVKAKIEVVISSRIEQERKRLTTSLQRLEAIAGASVDAPRKTRTGKRAKGNNNKGNKLMPKYRNPAKPDETWAGRGLRPKWLVTALKRKNSKLADFAVK